MSELHDDKSAASQLPEMCWLFFTDEHEEWRWLERMDGEEQRECRDSLLTATQLAHGAEALHRRHRSVLDACTQTQQERKQGSGNKRNVMSTGRHLRGEQAPVCARACLTNRADTAPRSSQD